MVCELHTVGSWSGFLTEVISLMNNGIMVIAACPHVSFYLMRN